MVRRRRVDPAVNISHVLTLDDAEFEGRCAQERYGSWEVEWQRVFGLVKLEGKREFVLPLLRAHLIARRWVFSRHVGCEHCAQASE